MNPNETTQELLERHTLEMRRSTMRVRIGGAIALVAMTGWLTWLHGQIASIDAEGVATLIEARAQVEMPKAIDALRERLAASAPDAIGRVQQQVLALPVQAREKFEAHAEAWIAENKSKLANAVANHIHFDPAQLRDNVAARYPDRDQGDQLKAVLADFVRGYREQVVALLAERAGDCEHITAELETRILHLAHGRKLSDQEQLQREILATLIELAPRLDARGIFGAASLDVAALGR